VSRGRLCTLIVVALAANSMPMMGAAPATVHVSTQITGGVHEYVVRAGDTLVGVGARFGVESRVLAAANGLSPTAMLIVGRVLTVDNRHVVPAIDSSGLDIVINVPQRMLFAFRNRVPVHAFPVAVGRSKWPTPIAPFRILMKEVHPTWDVPASIQDEMRRSGKRVITRMPPGPNNPLGDFWIGLSVDSLGIHGTPAPTTIYRFATHGCIRLHPDDVRTLFEEVSAGTTGALVYEPVLLAHTASGVFLEAHADAYGRRSRVSVDDVRSAAAAAGFAENIDWNAAAIALGRREAVARLVSPSLD
jgi:L,D-transpeptidase ErfK/SrfK